MLLIAIMAIGVVTDESRRSLIVMTIATFDTQRKLIYDKNQTTTTMTDN